jgi:hypothetical protein
VDHSDPHTNGFGRGPEIDSFPIDADYTPIRTVHPGQDVHEGGFARAVLTQQGVHLAAFEFERYLFIRYNTGKALPDASHFHEYFAWRRGGCDGINFLWIVPGRQSHRVLLPAFPDEINAV